MNSIPSIVSPPVRRAATVALLATVTFGLRMALDLIGGPWSLEHEMAWDGWGRISLLMARGYGLADTHLLTYFPLADTPMPTAARPPLPILLFAAVFRLFGERLLPIQILQACLDAATAAVTYFIAERLFRGGVFGPQMSGDTVARRAALLAALGFALFLPEWRNSVGFQSEPVFTLLFTAALGLVVLSERPLSHVAAGLLFGLAALARPGILVLPVVLAVWLVWARRVPRVQALIVPAVMLLILMPWAIRNERIFGRLIVTQTLLGYDLYRHSGSIAQDNYLRWIPAEEGNQRIEALLEAKGLSLRDISEPELDRLLQGEALKIIRAHPWRYLYLSLLRTTWLFYDPNVGSRTGLVQQMTGASSVVGLVQRIAYASSVVGLLALILFAMWRYPGRWIARLVPLWISLAYTVALHALLVAEFRFVLPLIPWLLCVSVYSLVRALPRFAARRQPSGAGRGPQQERPAIAGSLLADRKATRTPECDRQVVWSAG